MVSKETKPFRNLEADLFLSFHTNLVFSSVLVQINRMMSLSTIHDIMAALQSHKCFINVSAVKMENKK